MKKNFEAPYVKVVEVKNDIITGSINTPNNTMGNGTQLAPGRRGMFDDETNDEMDF